MEQIVITKTDGTTLNLCSRERPSVITKATQKIALLSDDLVSLTVVSAEPINFDFGDTITVFGKKYRLNQLPEPTKEGARKFTYEVEFEGIQYDLIDVMFKLPADCYGEQLYGDLESHLTALLWNINRVYPNKWTLGSFPKGTDYKNLNAAGKNCLQVLQEYCEEYEVEFEIATNATANTYTLNIVSKTGGTFSHALEYGRGKGLYKLQRKNINNSGITTRLYVYGSSDNLGKNYGQTKLCLPGTERLSSYIEDTAAVAKYGVKENEKTYDDIKPQRVGHVTSLGADVLTFADSSMFDLNERESDGTTTKWLIADTTAKITFQTGGLAGYSFDIHSYNHSTHTFVINKYQDENGMVFPSEDSAAFQIKAASDDYPGDAYIIEDITLPQSYITEAEQKLLAAGQTELSNVCQPQVSYSLELDELFFIRYYGRKIPTEVLFIGDYIHIIDRQIGVDKEVRITRIERNLLQPHSYTLQLADTVTKTTSIRVLNELQNLSEVVTMNGLANPTTARRRWKTAQELLSMVFDPDGDYYTDRIKPLSIETSMLSVGAKSQQFVLMNVTFEPNYGSIYANLSASAGTLVHYAIDPDNIVTWNMSATIVSLDVSSAYYIYARCSKTDSSGSWLITKQQYKVDALADEYTFLVGTVSSPVRDEQTGRVARSVSLTYGFSTINGRFIKTGRIESTAGTCYFDLDYNEIGGVIKFVKSDGTMGLLTDVDTRAQDAKDYIDNTLPDIITELQEQIDGQIEQYFEEYDPSDDTEPTATWIATDTAAGNDDEKEKHLGDLFYNTDSGRVYRYVRTSRSVGGTEVKTYEWQQLSDEELAQALQLANDALALAKTKRRIFTATPTTPYEIGDLWVQGTSGDIMRCKVSRATGNFSSDDWEKASKYTDDTALNNFLNNSYADTISTITEQIDGKIESWWSASDPSTAWTTLTERLAHEGDMWYNTDTKQLFRWVVIYSTTTGPAVGPPPTTKWKQIEDQKAIDAYAAAQNAQDTADGKRRVFVATPYPPYDVGDLWLTGSKTDGQLFRCIVARAEGESYVVTDWAEAVYYDNTKTTIDGGIVTSGTVQLVSPVSESIVAGITGGEDETTTTSAALKVRIWAGASKATRYSAPFRVLQSGKLYATDAEIKGKVTATSGEFTGTIHATDGEFNGTVNIGNGKIILNKDGSGSFANAGLSWSDQGILTAGTIAMNQCWGFNRHVGMASQYTAINRESSLVFLPIPDKETVYLPADPYHGMLYTIINVQNRYKTLNGNGNTINWKTGTSSRKSSSTYELTSYATVIMVFDGEWYVVAGYNS